MSLLKPRALVRGDRVMLVAPASRFDPEALVRARRVLEGWGLEVEGPAAAEPSRYLAASDDERAAALTEAFVRDDIAAVIGVRGGYGSARLLGRFDPAVAASNPKIFLGYSDLTVLLARLVDEAGLLCFHGPMATSDLARLGPADLERFRRFLFDEAGDLPGAQPAAPVAAVGAASGGWWAGSGLETRHGGTARGRLAGGCLSVLVTTLGTPYELDTSGAVLFLEDVGEPMYRIDRMLTQLAHAGKLDEVAAVVLGRFHRCGEDEDPAWFGEIADEILGHLGVPVVEGFDGGHGSGGAVLPFGCEVRVDADRGEIELLEDVFSHDDDREPMLARAGR